MGKQALSEKEITKQIRDYLDARGVWHYKAWQGRMSKHGIPDIIGCKEGQFFAIEVKTDRGKVSDEQTKVLAAIDIVGGIAIVARSLEDVTKWI